MVSSIPFNNCSKVYLGKIGQKLSNRIKEQYDCAIVNDHRENKTGLGLNHFSSGYQF